MGYFPPTSVLVYFPKVLCKCQLIRATSDIKKIKKVWKKRIPIYFLWSFIWVRDMFWMLRIYFFKKLLFKKLFIYLFIYGCVGSSFLCEGFLQLRQVGATLHRGARASHCRGLSCCGAQAPDAQAQWLWLTSLVAPRHVGSSQTRARTHVPCIGRRILNHCATREAPWEYFCLVISTAFLLSRSSAPFCPSFPPEG